MGKSTICIHCISIAHLVNKSIAISLAILSMKSIVIVIATVCAISSRICLLSANIKSNSAIVIRSVFRANLHKSHKQFQHSYHHLARRRHAAISSLVDRREQLSRKFFTSLVQPSSCLHIFLPTYNSIKICKQISTPPQPYQKIPDIYFLRSCTLPNFISIPSPITIQFVVDVFVLYVILYLLLYCLLCYLVL